MIPMERIVGGIEIKVICWGGMLRPRRLRDQKRLDWPPYQKRSCDSATVARG
jgi:hypothetical protein